MKINIIIVSLIFLVAKNCVAEVSASLTLDELIKNNYKQMTGEEISEVVLGKTVILTDLLSEAVYEIKVNKDGVAEKKIIKAKNPKMLTNVDYHSRAALLNSAEKFTISGNKIVTTDGVRTYKSTLYKKDNNIFGVRDVDHNSVNFQIVVESALSPVK